MLQHRFQIEKIGDIVLSIGDAVYVRSVVYIRDSTVNGSLLITLKQVVHSFSEASIPQYINDDIHERIEEGERG